MDLRKGETMKTMKTTREDLKFTERKNDKFRIRSTGHGSDHYGPCEVCGKHMSTAFILNHQMRYEDEELGSTFTHHGSIGMKFGHEECLKKSL